MRCLVTSSVVFALIVPACGDDQTSTGGTTLTEHYRRLGDNLGKTMAIVKASATTQSSTAPADVASVARLPKDLTGGVDIGADLQGKMGVRAGNIDGIAGDKNLTVLVPETATGAVSTTVSAPSFLAWAGDANSNDKGLCYLAWSKGASWFVTSKCGDTSGAWVCQVGTDIVCTACSSAGTCAPCDLAKSTFTCAW